MAEITRAAVEHFRSFDLDRLHDSPEVSPENDIFSSLKVEYPSAWRALAHVANSSELEMVYELSGNLAKEPHVPNFFNNEEGSVVCTVLSGIDPMLDPDLVSYLDEIKNGATPFFFSDSFKGVTRNPHKLYQVIDFVLECGAAFVTHNYYLEPTYASRRHPLLRPFHMSNEMIAKLANQAGLSQRHRDVLAIFKDNLAE